MMPVVIVIYRVSEKRRTNGALRRRRDYGKRQKNVKKILLDQFWDTCIYPTFTLTLLFRVNQRRINIL
jgi:hypothetical protein